MESMLVMRDHLVYGISEPFFFPAIDVPLEEPSTSVTSRSSLDQSTAA
jgi:hypothetical protein